ncbi:MAG: GNAT family N-acetyltransferase, partial [Planctomycetes bacterium]|nr:GNAT family N-acetyltransferase [Planctomycetota bacterium]
LWAEHCNANIDAVVLVAEVDGEVVGYALGTVETYAAIFRRRRYGLLSDLAVTAAHRGKGIGETLARRAIAWFQGAGVGEVHLFVLHNNEGARRFWRKLGWKDFVEQMVLDLA